jgi:hypothetical protein
MPTVLKMAFIMHYPHPYVYRDLCDSGQIWALKVVFYAAIIVELAGEKGKYAERWRLPNGSIARIEISRASYKLLPTVVSLGRGQEARCANVSTYYTICV